jgi:hypothetical protein
MSLAKYTDFQLREALKIVSPEGRPYIEAELAAREALERTQEVA